MSCLMYNHLRYTTNADSTFLHSDIGQGKSADAVSQSEVRISVMQSGVFSRRGPKLLKTSSEDNPTVCRINGYYYMMIHNRFVKTSQSPRTAHCFWSRSQLVMSLVLMTSSSINIR